MVDLPPPEKTKLSRNYLCIIMIPPIFKTKIHDHFIILIICLFKKAHNSDTLWYFLIFDLPGTSLGLNLHSNKK